MSKKDVQPPLDALASERSEAEASLTFGGHLRALISQGALESLYDELAVPRPKAEKEKLFGEIRRLERQLGVEPKKYNGG